MVGPGPTTHDFTVFRAGITIAPKRLNRHGRACPGHPRFILGAKMAWTRRAITMGNGIDLKRLRSGRAIRPW
jgi:hypothetical protein